MRRKVQIIESAISPKTQSANIKGVEDKLAKKVEVTDQGQNTRSPKQKES